MPRKEFEAFTRLDASDVNTFLMDQSVMTFASSAARGSAITAPVEGMVTWLNDENALQVYNGNAWNGLAASGGNAIINGAFEINQRNFTSSTASGIFTFDRWRTTASNGTSTYSSESFTLGSAPVAGYESRNFLRMVTTGQTLSSAQTRIQQPIESVRTFANQTVTVSFWAKSASGTPSVAVELFQFFGVSGSPSAGVSQPLAQKQAINTDWTLYSFTGLVPSIAGKTISTDLTDHLALNIFVSAGSDLNARTDSLGIQSNTFDIWGVQLEAGPTANVFRRNANSLAGELAACQRYFERLNTPNTALAVCQATSTTLAIGTLRFNTKRAAPSLAFNSAGDFTVRNATNSGLAATSITIANAGTSSLNLVVGVASGLVAGNAADMFLAGSASGFLDVSSEL